MAQPNKARAGFPFLWAIAGFCLLAILAVLLRPTPKVSSYDETRKNERLNRLNALHKEYNPLINSYGWVDKEKGIVRIPVEQAMTLTEVALKSVKPSPSEIKAENISSTIIPPYLQAKQQAEATAPAAPAAASQPAPAASPAPEAAPAAPAESSAPAAQPANPSHQ